MSYIILVTFAGISVLTPSLALAAQEKVIPPAQYKDLFLNEADLPAGLSSDRDSRKEGMEETSEEFRQFNGRYYAEHVLTSDGGDSPEMVDLFEDIRWVFSKESHARGFLKATWKSKSQGCPQISDENGVMLFGGPNSDVELLLGKSGVNHFVALIQKGPVVAKIYLSGGRETKPLTKEAAMKYGQRVLRTIERVLEEGATSTGKDTPPPREEVPREPPKPPEPRSPESPKTPPAAPARPTSDDADAEFAALFLQVPDMPKESQLVRSSLNPKEDPYTEQFNRFKGQKWGDFFWSLQGIGGPIASFSEALSLFPTAEEAEAYSRELTTLSGARGQTVVPDPKSEGVGGDSCFISEWSSESKKGGLHIYFYVVRVRNVILHLRFRGTAGKITVDDTVTLARLAVEKVRQGLEKQPEPQKPKEEMGKVPSPPAPPAPKPEPKKEDGLILPGEPGTVHKGRGHSGPCRDGCNHHHSTTPEYFIVSDHIHTMKKCGKHYFEGEGRNWFFQHEDPGH